MRYFTKELWMKMNDCDESIRTQAEKEWYQNSLRYQQEFEIARKHLSHRFIKEYLCRSGLHDYTILGMSFVKRGRTYSFEVQLTDGIEVIMLTMAALNSIGIDIDTLQYCVQGNLTWGYSEFEITPEGNIKLSVLCDMHNEMQFEFESIKLKETRRQGTVCVNPIEK